MIRRNTDDIEYPHKPKYRPDQYSYGMTDDGLNIYCNCNDCKMYADGKCRYIKMAVADETAGCATAIMRKWLKV